MSFHQKASKQPGYYSVIWMTVVKTSTLNTFITYFQCTEKKGICAQSVIKQTVGQIYIQAKTVVLSAFDVNINK